MTVLPLLLLLLAPPPTGADEGPPPPTAEELRLGRQVVELLTARDATALLELLDQRAHVAEGVARGKLARAWEASTPEQREEALGRVAGGWVRTATPWFHYADFVDARRVPDPDAGHGPVPERAWLQVLAGRGSSGRFREVLLMLAPDGRLIDLEIGPEFLDGENPAGPEGLRPQPLPRMEDAPLAWPEEIPHHDRQEARHWVAELDAPASPAARLRAQDEMFAWPHAAVPALLEAALAWFHGTDDAPREPALVAQVLEQLTGRALVLDAADLGASERSLAAFLAWHRRHLDSFEPLEPPPELLAALAGDAGDDPAAFERWEASLAAQQATADGEPAAPDPAEPVVAGSPPPAPVDEAAATGAPVGGGAAVPATPIPRPELGARPGDATAEAPAPPTPPAEPELAPALEQLVVLVDGAERPYPEVHPELDPERRTALRLWADTIQRVGLRVALGERPEHLVISFAGDARLSAATRQLDATAALMEPLLPDVGPAPLKTTLVFLYETDILRQETLWDDVLDAFVERRVLFEASADALRLEPGGLTLRAYPFVIQPTWDMAGNAAAGDDEFRLMNELTHKLAVCMLTNRVGQVPAGLRWAVGHFAELSLHGDVYQFNRTGFVSTDDHFDWERKAERWLEKRGGKKDFAFSERILEAGGRDPLLEHSVLAWSAVDTLCHTDPAAWAALLTELEALQREQDPFGLRDGWLPDEQATRVLLDEHLAGLEPHVVARHVIGHR